MFTPIQEKPLRLPPYYKISDLIALFQRPIIRTAVDVAITRVCYVLADKCDFLSCMSDLLQTCPVNELSSPYISVN